MPVSTHAPVRRRPAPPRPGAAGGLVSTHAPVRRRPKARYPEDAARMFQLTPPLGGDVGIALLVPARLLVSTHAPVRRRQGSGSRAARKQLVHELLFQLTPPLGGDSAAAPPPSSWRLFQLTPPLGGDLPGRPGGAVPPVSTHAPVRRRRGRVVAEQVVEVVSTHAPVRRRPTGASACTAPTGFQLTPPLGGDSGAGSSYRPT